jgi:precorrin-2 methylase
MIDSLISFAAVQNSALNDSNIVGRVLADPAGRAAVEELLQSQKVIVKALLEENAHLVEALRDALLEREELIGREINDVLAAAQKEQVIDLRAAEEREPSRP